MLISSRTFALDHGRFFSPLLLCLHGCPSPFPPLETDSPRPQSPSTLWRPFPLLEPRSDASFSGRHGPLFIHFTSGHRRFISVFLATPGDTNGPSQSLSHCSFSCVLLLAEFSHAWAHWKIAVRVQTRNPVTKWLLLIPLSASAFCLLSAGEEAEPCGRSVQVTQ